MRYLATALVALALAGCTSPLEDRVAHALAAQLLAERYQQGRADREAEIRKQFEEQRAKTASVAPVVSPAR